MLTDDQIESTMSRRTEFRRRLGPTGPGPTPEQAIDGLLDVAAGADAREDEQWERDDRDQT